MKCCLNCANRRPDNYTNKKTGKHYWGCSGFVDKNMICKLWNDIPFENRS